MGRQRNSLFDNRPRFQAAQIFLAGVLLVVGAACRAAPITPSIPKPYFPPVSVTLLPTPTERVSSLTPVSLPTPTGAPTGASTGSAPPTATPAPDVPAHLLIPALEVDEIVVAVPIVAGNWDVSELGSQVGWLPTTGEHPGDEWAMAFVGHVSLSNGTSGPFGYLWRLRPGAEIIYQTGETQYVYALTEKRDVSADTVKALYVADGDQIVLMTCDNWDFVNWRYTERLLVLAELVEQRDVSTR